MTAKLLIAGNKVKIYTIESKNGNEVLKFLQDQKHPEKRSIITGFIKIIELIAEYGYDKVHEGWFKGWREGCEFIYEIKKKKKNYRISCFKYDGGSKLLLTTVFVKKKWKEKKEYMRAISYKKKFDNMPNWKESDYA